MERHDTIVVGGGMAGLSTAAFLTLAGRSVLLLEKHDKVGGYASSFEHRGVRFDIGIEGIRELAPDSFLPPFLRWWGVELPMKARRERMSVTTDRGRYLIRGEAAREDLRAAFPASARSIDRFLDLNARILAEMRVGPAPRPPGETGFLGKLAFGMSTLARRPNLTLHGLRNSSKVLGGLFDDPDLLRVAASKTFEEMVYLGVAHRWEAFSGDGLMYPSGGIGALPEAVAASVAARGGSVRRSAEVVALRRIPSGFEVDLADGGSASAAKVVVAAPMPWAAFSLLRGEPSLDALRAAIRRRRPFASAFMVFAALDPSFDTGGANYLVDWADGDGPPSPWAARRGGRGPDAATAPLACVVSGTERRPGEPIAMTAMATLGRDYAGGWGLGNEDADEGRWLDPPSGYRASTAYRRIKAETEARVLARLEARLGRGFRDALRFSLSATPLSFARYTRSPGGSYMGFSIDAGEYGRFFPQESPVPGLFFSGQWVFPGFGVAGASASGYYAAKALLAGEGSDLDARLRAMDGGKGAIA